MLPQLDTPLGALLAATLAGVLFFLLDWTLQWPHVWKVLLETWLRREDAKLAKLKSASDEFNAGLRFRVVCAVHNTPQSVLAVWALLSRELWEDSLYGRTTLAQCVVAVTCGFFVWDITAALKRVRIDGVVPVVHGGVCMSLLLYILCTGNCQFYGVASIIWEMSTFFVHVGWILYKLGMQRTRIYFYNGLSMLASFGVCRIIWGTFIAAKFFTLSSSEVAERIGTPAMWMLRCLCLSGNLLNYYWYWKMITLSKKAVAAMRSKGKEPLKDA